MLNSYTVCIQASMVDHDYRLPPELKNILQSVRVFGNFEQPVFLELCKSFLTSCFIQLVHLNVNRPVIQLQ